MCMNTLIQGDFIKGRCCARLTSQAGNYKPHFTGDKTANLHRPGGLLSSGLQPSRRWQGVGGDLCYALPAEKFPDYFNVR